MENGTYQVFNLTGYSFGLMIAIAALVQLLAMGILGHRRLPQGTVRIFGILSIVLGLFFSRLFFCIGNLSLFLETYENPLLMLRFFDGGLAMPGLLLGITCAALVTARLMKVGVLSLLDIMVLPLGFFLAICRLGEGFTELGVGKIIEEGFLIEYAPWLFLSEAMGVTTEYRLAVFRYEAVAGVLIGSLLFYWFCKNQKKNPAPGDLTLLFFALYGSVQTLLESMRDDGHMLLTFLRINQVFAALLPLLAAAIWSRRYAKLQWKSTHRVLISWFLLILCVSAGILLEFSLDGRLPFGTSSLLVNYLLLAIVCVLFFIIPFSFLVSLSGQSEVKYQ